MYHWDSTVLDDGPAWLAPSSASCTRKRSHNVRDWSRNQQLGVWFCIKSWSLANTWFCDVLCNAQSHHRVVILDNCDTNNMNQGSAKQVWGLQYVINEVPLGSSPFIFNVLALLSMLALATLEIGSLTFCTYSLIHVMWMKVFAVDKSMVDWDWSCIHWVLCCSIVAV